MRCGQCCQLSPRLILLRVYSCIYIQIFLYFHEEIKFSVFILTPKYSSFYLQTTHYIITYHMDFPSFECFQDESQAEKEVVGQVWPATPAGPAQPAGPAGPRMFAEPKKPRFAATKSQVWTRSRPSLDKIYVFLYGPGWRPQHVCFAKQN